MDLQIAPPPDHNNPVPKFLLAAAVMTVVGIAIFMLNPRKTAEISVQKVDIFAPHTVMNATAGVNKIIGEAASSEDDLYVVATIKVTDKLRLPISIDSYSATLTMAGGGTVDATVIAGNYLPRVGDTFPQFLPLVQPPAARPIKFDDSIGPGETLVGTVVLLFPNASEKDWHAKKSAILHVSLAHNAAPLSIALP